MIKTFEIYNKPETKEFVQKLKKMNSTHYEEQLLKLQTNKYNL